MDTVSRKKRSEIMGRVRAKNSKMELVVQRGLRSEGLGFGKHVGSLPGTPDLAFRKHRVAVFLDSCFWHGCKRHGTMPKTNKVFWRTKLSENRRRDRSVNRVYRKMGWTVLRFWEHDIKKDVARIVSRILTTLESENGKT